MLPRALVPLVVGFVAVVLLLSSPTPTSAAVCGGSGYDLSSITFSDLTFNDTVGQSTWYFHPCGGVSAAGCQQLGGNVMLCQLPYSGSSAYAIASWVPESTQSITSWVPYGGGGGGPGGNRGVRMLLANGGSCSGSSGTPSLTVTFQCNNTLPAGIARFVTVNQTAHCVYAMTVQTSAVCQGPNSTVNGQVACGTTGLDLSPITTTDLVWRDVTFNYTSPYTSHLIPLLHTPDLACVPADFLAHLCCASFG
jgi:hypothetical protein